VHNEMNVGNAGEAKCGTGAGKTDAYNGSEFAGEACQFELPWEVSLKEACVSARQFLASCGVEDAAVDAWYLLEYVTGISRAVYLADGDRRMNSEQRNAYAKCVKRRGAHIPLQYLTGEQEFMGFSFLVNEHVLIPRQDTETLVELGLKISGRHDSPCRVLDLCTGSGCIAISMAKLWGQQGIRPVGSENRELQLCGRMAADGWQLCEQKARDELQIYASDISEDALAVARENARRLDVDVQFIQSDLFAQIPAQVFDMVVSNPPYIRTSVVEELSEEVQKHEPRLALDGGADGLDFYRRIIRESPQYLCPGGYLLLEIGYDQGAVVADLMRENGFSCVQITKDLPGNDRVVSGRSGTC